MAFSEGRDSTSDPVARFDDDDLHPEGLELLSGCESSDAGADDDDLSGRLRRRRRSLEDAEVDVAVALEKRVDAVHLKKSLKILV